jgi:hypothetical protein
MKDLDRIAAHLTQVLGFFPRVDTKAGGLFAFNAAMITITALNVKAGDLERWYIGVPAVLMVVGLLASYFFLYRCNFPDLRGGQGSLIYFSEVQRRAEADFINDYEAATDDAYRRDLLGQVWRNSEILCAKYKDVAVALRCTLTTLVPFTWLLVAESIVHAAVPAMKG